jgi:hypothetical protein
MVGKYTNNSPTVLAHRSGSQVGFSHTPISQSPS